MTNSTDITNLLCEYLPHPLGIDVVNPRLSWQLQSDRRGARQTAYQVLVAGTESGLNGEEADLWDSGKVISDQSVHVVYEGQALRSAQRAWWKVRVWDENDQVSAYSSPTWWEMGLLDQSEWK